MKRNTVLLLLVLAALALMSNSAFAGKPRPIITTPPPSPTEQPVLSGE